MQKKTVIRVLSVLFVLLNMAAIFAFSAQDATKSDKTSKGTIEAIAKIVDKDFEKMSQVQKDRFVADLNGFVRKAAHFSIYCLLGLLTANALFRFSVRRLPLMGLSVGICALYAASDEFHQYFVPGRSCQMTDVLIDTGGAVLGTAIFMLLAIAAAKIKAKRRASKNDKET